MHPNTTKCNKSWVWGPIGSIECVRYENIRRDFVARTFALIAPVRPILHRVYCRNKMLPNAPKHYETHHNMNLGSDAVDWADLLQRILLQLCGLNFCFNCNSSAWFEPSIVKQRNGPKCTQTLRNKTKHDFKFQWGWISCIRCEKFGNDFVAWTFALIAPVQPISHRVHAVTKWSQMHPNTTKHNKSWVWGSNGGGSGAFVAKTSDASSWHDILN
jgi:hypothetical protein